MTRARIRIYRHGSEPCPDGADCEDLGCVGVVVAVCGRWNRGSAGTREIAPEPQGWEDIEAADVHGRHVDLTDAEMVEIADLLSRESAWEAA